MPTTGRAPGNLFLFGEHAVVYGQPAIVASVDRYTKVSFSDEAFPNLRILSDAFGTATGRWAGKKIAQRAGPQELDIIFDLLEAVALSPAGAKISISSQIPVKSGMSSSSAVLAATVGGAASFFRNPMTKADFFKFLYPFQKRLHGGKASGAELISSISGGFTKIMWDKKNLTFESIRPKPLTIVVADTNVHAPTALTVAYHVPSLRVRYPKKVETAFSRIGRITEAGRRALQKGNLKQLGSLMNQNQAALASLGLSHPKLDDCIEEALKAGALGAKLSGSGWGGIMFALTTEARRQKVADAMARTGADVFSAKLGVAGVSVSHARHC